MDALLLAWLRHACSYGDAKPHLHVQRITYVRRIADLIEAGDLDLVQDREALERFLQWVDSWEAHWKSSLYDLFDFLKFSYPGTDLWETVKFTPAS